MLPIATLMTCSTPAGRACFILVLRRPQGLIHSRRPTRTFLKAQAGPGSLSGCVVSYPELQGCRLQAAQSSTPAAGFLQLPRSPCRSRPQLGKDPSGSSPVSRRDLAAGGGGSRHPALRTRLGGDFGRPGCHPAAARDARPAAAAASRLRRGVRGRRPRRIRLPRAGGPRCRRRPPEGSTAAGKGRAGPAARPEPGRPLSRPRLSAGGGLARGSLLSREPVPLLRVWARMELVRPWPGRRGRG